MKIKKYTNGAWTDLDKPVKKYDTYTDETTTLPLTIEASTTDAIENYQVYGTSEGAGVETESGEPAGFKIPILNTSGNVFNASDSDRIEGSYLNSLGALVANTEWGISEYKNTNPNEIIAIIGTLGSAPSICFYNENKTFISGIAYEGNTPIYATAPPNTKYFRASYGIVVANQVQIIRQSNYDLFVGDSKLYADEYVDFSEQKIYRTIILTTHDNKDFITSDSKRFCVRRSNNV